MWSVCVFRREKKNEANGPRMAFHWIKWCRWTANTGRTRAGTCFALITCLRSNSLRCMCMITSWTARMMVYMSTSFDYSKHFSTDTRNREGRLGSVGPNWLPRWTQHRVTMNYILIEEMAQHIPHNEFTCTDTRAYGIAPDIINCWICIKSCSHKSWPRGRKWISNTVCLTFKQERVFVFFCIPERRSFLHLSLSRWHGLIVSGSLYFIITGARTHRTLISRAFKNELNTVLVYVW